MKLTYAHLMLKVSNFEQSEKFYKTAFGLVINAKTETSVYLGTKKEPYMIELILTSEKVNSEVKFVYHTDDFIKSLTKHKKIICEQGENYYIIKDPDGNMIKVMVPETLEKEETFKAIVLKTFIGMKPESSTRYYIIEVVGKDVFIGQGYPNNIADFKKTSYKTNAECIKSAKKRVEDKKGVVNNDFCDYICAPNAKNIHSKQHSHHKFVNNFKDSIYYDACDDYSPFGSDEGADLLSYVINELHKNPALSFDKIPNRLVNEVWNLKYMPVNTLNEKEVMEQAKIDGMHMQISDMINYSTAFAQIKTCGKVSTRLKERALNSLKRFVIMNHNAEKTSMKLYEDLLNFEAY